MDLPNNALSALRQAVADGRFFRRWPAAVRRLDRPALLRAGLAVLNVGLVLLIADSAAGIVWTWAQPAPGRAAIGSFSAEAERPRGGDYRLLTTFDPFHRAAAPVAEAQTEAARETTLDLKLFGVRAGLPNGGNDGGNDGQDDRQGSAIIRTPDKKQGAFKAGDVIMDGVTLKSILPDRVVISHRGVLENLFLDEDSQTLIAAANSHKTVTQEKQKSRESNGMVSMDEDRLMAAINARPRLTGQGVEGFVLTPGQDPALFNELGLVAGDVLLAVNGNRLDSAERARDLKDQLRTAQSIQLEIERDGKKKVIEFSNE